MNKYILKVIFAINLLSLILIGFLIEKYKYFQIDLITTKNIQAVQIPLFKEIMILISLPGYGALKYLCLSLVAGFIYLQKRKREAIFLLISTLGAEGLSILIKHIVSRPRPTIDLIEYIYQVEKTASFPSGHVVYYVGFFGFLLFLSHAQIKTKIVRNVAIAICLFFIMFVGLSRIYLGAHWLSDVTGGYLAGSLWLLLSIYLYNARSGRKRDDKSKS